MYYYPHDFKMVRRTLHCERVPLHQIVEEVGTPVYVYSYKTLVDHFRKLKSAFRKVKPLICFSVKSNGNMAILKLLVNEGAGLDIVSGGELYKALRAGCPGERVVYASVGKTPQEIKDALKAKIFFFNVESAAELELIDRMARQMKVKANVALRFNPDVDAKTHKHITTAVSDSKFGIDAKTVRDLFANHASFEGIRFSGIHMHIGSQITQSGPFVEAVRKAGQMIQEGRKLGVELDHLNLGGGLGIVYKNEEPQSPQTFAEAISPMIEKLGVKLILEPGRFIVGNAGALITKVIYVKESHHKRFAVVDAGMNDLLRPALYEAYHEVVPVNQDTKAAKEGLQYDVVGPVCESADVFARDRELGRLDSDNLLAIFGAGAYGSTMASNYNGRLRPAEVIVKGNQWEVIRRRESLRDLTRYDVEDVELISGISRRKTKRKKSKTAA